MINEFIAKAITAQVKEKIAEDDWLAKCNKGFKLISISEYGKGHGKEWGDSLGHYGGNHGDVAWMRLLAKFQFKAAKYEDNVIKYEIMMYSDGSMGVYFEGFEYDPEIGKK